MSISLMKFFTVATGKVLKETKSYDKMIEKRNNRKEYKRKTEQPDFGKKQRKERVSTDGLEET